MSMPLTVAAAPVLPALSVGSTVAVADWLAPSVLSVTGSAQLATPARLSSQLKFTVTLLLYQPLAFGDVAAAPLIVGTVASRLIVTETSLADPPALVAEHL